MSLGDWLDERTGYRALVRHALDEPVPGGSRFAYVWGSALTLSLVVQAVTGVVLMSAYAPSATTAWSSVAYISFTLRAGWIVRGLHHFGAHAMVVLLALHIGQTALYGAYKKPREVNWFFGLGLLATTLGFALTGYLLPWDQKGYWATRVATNILGSIPAIGGWMQRLVVGGSEYGHMTLTHFYALHVGVLPAITVALVVAHVALMRRHGITPPQNADLGIVERFYPKQVAKDLGVGLLVLAVIFALTLREHGAPLDAPADPSSDYPARPEWYFLALFETLKYFKGALEPIGAIGVPLVAVGFLFALPLLDRGPSHAVRARLPYLGGLAALGLGAVLLTLSAIRADAHDEAFQRARRVATKRADQAIVLFAKGVPPAGPLAMLKADPNAHAQAIFQQSCATCHTLGELAPPSRDEETAPDLTGYGTKAWVLGLLKDPDAPHYFGKTPFKGEMPSMVDPPKDPAAAAAFTPMTPADQEAVADFLVVQAKGEKGTGMPGEKIVKQRCTTCHRLDGQTDDDESNAPELRGWASAAWIAAQIENPGSGKTYPASAMAQELRGHMPAFGDKLSPADRAALVAWLTTSR